MGSEKKSFHPPREVPASIRQLRIGPRDWEKIKSEDSRKKISSARNGTPKQKKNRAGIDAGKKSASKGPGSLTPETKKPNTNGILI